MIVEQRDEAAGLRRDGQERGHRGGRALVGVGRPEVEGHRADLEREPDEREEDRHREQAAVGSVAAYRKMSLSRVEPLMPKTNDMP